MNSNKIPDQIVLGNINTECMPDYYVNRNEQPDTGDHEVHKSGCIYFPHNPIHLGNLTNCHEAVREAKQHYDKVDGCKTCSYECHKS